MDATGKVVGPLVGPWPSDTPSGEANLVAIKVNGTPLELPVSQSGFVDGANSNNNSPNLYGTFSEYYASGDCSGPGLINIANDGLAPLNPNTTAGLIPLVESSIFLTGSGSESSSGPQIWNGVLYYGAAPFANTTAGSFQTGENPTSLGSCQEEAGGTEILAPLITTPVSSLGFTPPFSIQ